MFHTLINVQSAPKETFRRSSTSCTIMSIRYTGVLGIKARLKCAVRQVVCSRPRRALFRTVPLVIFVRMSHELRLWK
jgi:hypothetical protein